MHICTYQYIYTEEQDMKRVYVLIEHILAKVQVPHDHKNNANRFGDVENSISIRCRAITSSPLSQGPRSFVFSVRTY